MATFAICVKPKQLKVKADLYKFLIQNEYPPWICVQWPNLVFDWGKLETEFFNEIMRSAISSIYIENLGI